MNEYYEIHKQTRVIPLLVTLTEEEWFEAQRYLPGRILYLQCQRNMMRDESELADDSHFGDFIRWLFKLAPTDKNIPIDVVVRRVRE